MEKILSINHRKIDGHMTFEQNNLFEKKNKKIIIEYFVSKLKKLNNIIQHLGTTNVINLPKVIYNYTLVFITDITLKLVTVASNLCILLQFDFIDTINFNMY